MSKRPQPCVIDGRRCPEHDGVIHGKEAQELRKGVERYIADLEGGFDVRVGATTVADSLQHLLDRVDARDSLAYLERKRGGKRHV